ncbi:MAG: hypothetical protein U1E67_19220 [Hyphomicrobiales bacterium]
MAIRTEEQQAGFLATMRRFPGKQAQIEMLMASSEVFQDMCEELALVEATLAKIDQLPPSVRDSRLKECNGWIDRLNTEIAEALCNINVIPLKEARRPAR